MRIAHLVSFIAKFCLALLIGASIALVVVQRDERVKTAFEHKIKAFFHESCDGDFDGTIREFNLLWPSIVFDHVVVTPRDGSRQWAWYCQQMTVQFSWLSFLMTGALALQFSLSDYTMDSLVEKGQMVIMPHLIKLLLPPASPIPLYLKDLAIRNGTIQLTDAYTDSHIQASFHGDMRRIGDRFRMTLYSHDGHGYVASRDCLEHMNGTLLIECGYQQNGDPWVALTSNIKFNLPQLGDASTCFLLGSWDHDHGTFSVYNTDRTLVIDPIAVGSDQRFACTVKAPLFYLQRLVPALSSVEAVNGSCIVTVTGDARAPYASLKADVAIEQCSYKNITLPLIRFAIDSMPEHAALSAWQGCLNLTLATDSVLSGSWSWHEHGGGSYALTNPNQVTVPVGRYWVVKPNALSCTASVTPGGAVQAAYACTVEHTKMGSQISSAGMFEKQGDRITGKGTWGSLSYDISCVLDPFILERFSIKEAEAEHVVLTTTGVGDQAVLESRISYPWFRSLLPDRLKQELAGEGTLVLSARGQGSNWLGTLSLEQGIIKVPQLYNFITALHAAVCINPYDRRMEINDFYCTLHRGALSSKHMTLCLDDRYNLNHVSAPLVIDAMFISWQKDLFALISGVLDITKHGAQPWYVRGTIIADKAQLKGNLFSSDMQRSLLLLPEKPVAQEAVIEGDLRLMSREPLVVRTPFLDVRASFDIALKKSLHAPQVSGSIDVLSGVLKFPYKPLTITTGKMYLMPQQLFDPLIELTAKNKIKRHDILMQVTGSLQDPHISFQATPPLTEEQIIALLLAGSEQGSLHLAMPSLIMNNVQSLIFGSSSESPVNSYLGNMFKPLRAVRIVPSFVEETGRGGLRGAVEIEVNDQLNAVIEKNFSLSEDTKFTIDYSLSDEVSVRGIKDERGDLGGEMELRWKF